MESIYQEALKEFDKLVIEHGRQLVKQEYDNMTDEEKARFDKWFPEKMMNNLEDLRKLYRICKQTNHNKSHKVNLLEC